MNKLMRKLGFTLVEVILGSVIIAGFVGTTVYTAGEIGMARRASLASLDKSAWATLQTQYAAEGVAAPGSEAKVWGGAASKNFGVITNAGGSLYVISKSENVNASSFSTKGTVGKSLCVNAFQLSDLNKAATDTIRQNVKTVGLILMDRASYSNATAGNGTTINPVSDPMKKPDGLFGLSTSLAIAKYNPATGKYTEVPSSSVTMDALTELNWSGTTGTTPAFYILIKTASGTIDDASCYLNGSVSVSYSSNLPSGVTGYAGSFPVTIGQLANISSSVLSITTTAHNTATSSYSYGKGAVTISPVRPTLLQSRVSSLTGTEIATSQVSIYDVLNYSLSSGVGYNYFRSGVSALNGTTISALMDSATANQYIKSNATAILSNLTVYDYIDSTVSGVTTTKPVSGLTLGTTGYNNLTVTAAHFDSSGTAPFTWRTSDRADGVIGITPYSALIASVESSTSMGITTIKLPNITYAKASGATITIPSVDVAATTASLPKAPILSTFTEDAGYPLYSLYYSYRIGSAPEIPSLSSSSGVVSASGGTESFGSLSNNTTVYVKTVALANPIYSLFLDSGAVASAIYQYSAEDEKEAKTVMKVNYIKETLDYYVQGSIQVLKSDSFKLNAGNTIGLNLYVTGNPSITLNSNIAYKIYGAESPSSYSKATCSIVGTYYSGKYKEGTSGNGGTVSGNSGETILINNVPSAYKMPIITNSSTTVPLVTVPTWAASNDSWISVNSANNSTKNTYNASTTSYSGNVVLAPGTYNSTFTLDGANSIIYLSTGTYYIYGLNFNGPGQIVTDGNVILYLKTLSLNNSDVKVTMNSDGSYTSSSGGSTFGSIASPITIYLASTTNDSMELKGRIFGTLYYNGHINLTNCVVMGKVECNSINMNSQCWLFIKQW